MLRLFQIAASRPLFSAADFSPSLFSLPFCYIILPPFTLSIIITSGFAAAPLSRLFSRYLLNIDILHYLRQANIAMLLGLHEYIAAFIVIFRHFTTFSIGHADAETPGFGRSGSSDRVMLLARRFVTRYAIIEEFID